MFLQNAWIRIVAGRNLLDRLTGKSNENQANRKFLLKIVIKVHFVEILISFLFHYHWIVWLRKSLGEGSKIFLPDPDSSKTFWQLGCQVATLFPPLPCLIRGILLWEAWNRLQKQKCSECSETCNKVDTKMTKGAKSATTWQPSCQKVFEESGTDRKFSDLSHTFSYDWTIWW